MKHILVIDDSEDMQHFINVSLSSDGYKVSIAEDGISGFNSAKKYLPDLIILDNMLPKMSGVQVCAMLKGNIKTKSIPVIMFSAKQNEKDLKIYQQVKVDDFLSKPFVIEDLKEKINNFLNFLP
ncbi:hypothetical protein BVX93_01510 [bacterium B13(2017)]|nr:hypothetical protein BVX93_01510 [bacterium B13(2017)]